MGVRFVVGAVIGFAGALLTGANLSGQGAPDGPAFQELAGRLQDSNLVVRTKALAYIGAMKPFPKDTAPHVIRLLKDPDYNARAAAANALGNLQNALPDLGSRFPEAVPQLMRLLSDKAPEDKYQQVRRQAAYALRHLGASSRPAVPELLKIAADEDDDAAVRTEAVQALGAIGGASPQVLAVLTKLLEDPARTNANYPTVGSTAQRALGRLATKADNALPVLLERLRDADPGQRRSAAASLGTVGFGSVEVETRLLDLLADKSVDVQKAALSSLEGINDTHKFFFRPDVSSRAVSERQQAMLAEIRGDAARRARFAQILAAQVRLGEGHHPRRADALGRLVELDAREHLPMLREQFAALEKKTVYLEWRDLRLQLLRALAKWLPEDEVVPFLSAVDADSDEAPQVRFRAAALLCERGDAGAVAHIVKRHLPEAKKVEPLLGAGALRRALQDRRLFAADADFAGLKAIGPGEIAAIQTGIRLTQHLYGVQRRGAIQSLTPTKVRVRDGAIEGIRFFARVPSEGWGFELTRQGDLWLPRDFRMGFIE